MINVQPVTLRYENISLEPLQLHHAIGLKLAAADGKLWELTVTSVPEPDKTELYIEQALQMQAQGTRLPFVVIEQPSGKVLGCTSYHDIIATTDRLEIGYTWYAKSVQRTRVNSICKLMLMQHAFETLGCKLVGWRTDILNVTSQRAIERLGASREGIILHNLVRRNGTVRDTVMYGMTVNQWPEHKGKLLERLNATPVNLAPTSIREAHISLALVDKENHLDVIRLNPGALGLQMVATNGVSLAQASFNPNAWPRAVLAGDTVVGFVMLFDPTLVHQTEEPNDVLYIWRIMIDLKHQGKGYGAAVIKLIQERALEMPAITALKLSHGQGVYNPGSFYERLGFKHTGVIEDQELEMSWDVQAHRLQLEQCPNNLIASNLTGNLT
jgi:N-acetyltransferase